MCRYFLSYTPVTGFIVLYFPIKLRHRLDSVRTQKHNLSYWDDIKIKSEKAVEVLDLDSMGG